MRQAQRIATSLLGAALLAASGAFAQQAATPPKAATATTESANAAVRQAMAIIDKRDIEDATRGKLAELSDPLVKAADGRIVWDTQALRLPEGRRAGHGQPQPVAAAAAERGAGAVQGDRRRLPDPRLRHRQHDAGRGRHRLDRDRHPADAPTWRGRAEAGDGHAEEQQAGGRGDLHAQPRRPLRRRARRGRRGRRALGQGARSSRPTPSWSTRSPRTYSPATR